MSDRDAREKLLLLTAALFAVRLFRAPPEKVFVGATPENQAKLDAFDKMNRDAAAREAAADAEAIMVAVYAVKL